MTVRASALSAALGAGLLLVHCIGDAPIPPLALGPDASSGDAGADGMTSHDSSAGDAKADGAADAGGDAADANPCNAVTQCVSGDMCCPAGCTSKTDNDCAVAVCGDGIVEPGEACDIGLPNPNGGACDPSCLYTNTFEHISGFTGGVGYNDSDAGPNVRFAKQGGLATDGTVLYYADPGGTIRQLDPTSGASTTIAGSNANTSADADDAGTSARFASATWLSYVDASGTNGEKMLFVLDGTSVRGINVRDPSFPVSTFLTGQTGLASLAAGTDASGPVLVSLVPSEASLWHIISGGFMSAAPLANQTQLNDIVYAGPTWGSANCQEVFFAGYDASTTTATWYFGCPDTIIMAKEGPGSTTVSLFAGVPKTAGCADNANALAATLTSPVGLSTDASGALYFTDCGKIRKVGAGGVTTYAGSGTAGYGDATGGNLGSAQFSALGSTTQIGGTLYAVDGPRIRTVSGTTTSTLASGSGSRGTIVDPTGAGPSYGSILGLATDSSSNIYVLEANEVLKVNPTTGGSSVAFTIAQLPDAGSLTPIAITATSQNLFLAFSNGTVWKGGFDGTGFAQFASVQLNELVNDGTNLYFIRSDSVIGEIDATGAVTVVCGRPNANEVQDGTGANAFFEMPMGLAYAGNSTLYVADFYVGFGGILVRRIDIAPGKVTTVAGYEGSNAQAQVDGVGTAAGFGAIRHMASDGTSLFIADKGFAYTIPLLDGPTIREMNLNTMNVTTYTVSTMIGALGEFAAAPGQGKGARINDPQAIVFDPVKKQLLVADESALFRIR